MSGEGQAFSAGDLDFDAIYQGRSAAAGGVEFGGFVPWDIGEPQPAVVEFEETGRIRGAVLDVGCGLGDAATFLAGRGYRVTGVDGASSAIEQAKERARVQGVTVEFAVADATDLSGYDGRFDTVVDSALYHCIDADRRAHYAAVLYRVTRPGAFLNMLCFSDALPDHIPGSIAVSEEQIRGPLGEAGWIVTGVRPYAISAWNPQQAVARAAVDADGVIDARAAAAGAGDDARISMPAWIVAAHRP